MNSIIRVVTNKIASRILNDTLRGIPKHLYVIPIQTVHVTPIKMAQRSITSFFKVTPPKPAVKTDADSKSSVKKNCEDSPVANGKEKVSSKRPHLESSESDSTSPKKQSSPPVSTGKKKPVKRQRIESSGSESEPPMSKASPEPESPKHEIKTEVTVKTEKESPKTYASPKSKKKKALTEQNRDTSPTNADKNTKNDVKSPKQTVNSPKHEVKSPKTVKSAKKIIKKEKSVEKEVKKATSKKETVKTEKQETGDKSKSKDKEEKGDKETVAETDYNPSKSKYHPISDACWTKGTPVPYLALAKTLELIEGTSARLKIIEILSNYLRSVMVLTPEDLLPSVYLCLNQLAPAYHSLELGIAETYLMKAVGQCTGRSLSQMKAALSKSGDLGAVAELARNEQRTMFTPKPLSVRGVFAGLKEIAKITGQASVNKKINKIQSLYVACRHSEARYLIRSLEGKLRIGLAEQSVLQALALAATLTPPPCSEDSVLDAAKGLDAEQLKARVDENSLIIKTTYCECPNYESVLPTLLQHGVAALPTHCRLTPGVPLKPMLAHPTKGLSQVFDRFEKESFTCEWKYDGERAQIHVPGDDAPRIHQAAIFSRNQENNTSKYPDVLRRLPSLLRDSVTSCVLDCEAVAYDTVNKQILPFQILSTRKRKDAQECDIKVQVCVFVFDLLFLNGAALVREPLQTRRALLREHFNEVEGCWQLATSRDCSTVEEVQACLEQSVRGHCEGLMVKALTGEHSKYDIARRSHNWLKLKKDYIEGIGDTIDVVVIGAYLGKGKRAGRFGGFLLACVDPSTEEYQTLCKIGTGFSDDDLATFTEALREHVIDAPRTYYRYESSQSADVWVSARVVWEIRCADLSLSPVHRAALGLVHPEKGISLRFPRFVRVRTDKSPEQATSAQQIAQMYLAQDQVKNSAVKHSFADEFY